MLSWAQLGLTVRYHRRTFMAHPVSILLPEHLLTERHTHLDMLLTLLNLTIHNNHLMVDTRRRTDNRQIRTVLCSLHLLPMTRKVAQNHMERPLTRNPIHPLPQTRDLETPETPETLETRHRDKTPAMARLKAQCTLALYSWRLSHLERQSLIFIPCLENMDR